MSNRNNRKIKKANHGKRPANRNRRAAKSAKFKN
jgi:hypothetical protein